MASCKKQTNTRPINTIGELYNLWLHHVYLHKCVFEWCNTMGMYGLVSLCLAPSNGLFVCVNNLYRIMCNHFKDSVLTFKTVTSEKLWNTCLLHLMYLVKVFIWEWLCSSVLLGYGVHFWQVIVITSFLIQLMFDQSSCANRRLYDTVRVCVSSFFWSPRPLAGWWCWWARPRTWPTVRRSARPVAPTESPASSGSLRHTKAQMRPSASRLSMKVGHPGLMAQMHSCITRIHFELFGPLTCL